MSVLPPADMSNVIKLPIAAAVGCTHVAVAQFFGGQWAVVLWSRESGPQMLGNPSGYQQAVDHAVRVSARFPGAILDLPEGCGLIHVRRTARGDLEVMHESRSGESFTSLAHFGPHERDEAVRFALSQLGQYPPSRLGEVISC